MVDTLLCVENALLFVLEKSTTLGESACIASVVFRQIAKESFLSIASESFQVCTVGLVKSTYVEYSKRPTADIVC